MRLLRKALLALCLIFLVSSAALANDATDPFSIRAKSYVVMVEGQTIWARRPDKPLPPASLTKIMTALLTVENANPDDVVTVSRDAAWETGTRLGLKAGDRMTVRSLLKATLIYSANDACHALADHVGGEHWRFVWMMNRKARDMGLKGTHFTNACGHDKSRHFSTASDLARLASEALKNPLFSTIVASDETEVATADGSRTFLIRNKNKLIGRYPGVIGVKTGFTRRAGDCLIALAERNGVRGLIVLLNSPDRWRASPMIFEEAFSRALAARQHARADNIRQ